MTTRPGQLPGRRDSGWWRLDRGAFGRYAFASGYLACYLVADLVYVLLNPRAQAALTAWASTSVANLEHEPVGGVEFESPEGRVGLSAHLGWKQNLIAVRLGIHALE